MAHKKYSFRKFIYLGHMRFKVFRDNEFTYLIKDLKLWRVKKIEYVRSGVSIKTHK